MRLALVHLASETEAAPFFARHGLADVPRFSDPRQELYRAFGLQRGRWWQVLGPKVFWRGFVAAVLKGHGFGWPKHDPLQLPGAFLLRDGVIVRAFRHATSADRPDYCELAA